MWRLSILGEQWRIENTITKKDNSVTIPIMPFNEISKILKDNLHFKMYGTTERTADVFVYDYDTGLYKEAENYINRCISTIEDRYDALKYKRIYNRIKADLDLSYIDRTHYLIAVNNGIFNYNTKVFEEFNPKYFFISKIDTDYTIDAIKNNNAIKDTYFDYDDWLNSIACNDDEIVTLLWQLTNEAFNPNKTRGKVAILIGNGKNGKGTFQEMLRNLIGETNVGGLKVHQFQSKNDPFSLENLENAICNIGDDIGLKPIDEIDIIKSIATGDTITINRKGKKYKNYSFKLLLMFSANGMPPIKEKTEAVLNRLLIVPFNANFKGTEDNSIREEKLKNKVVREYILYKALNMDFDKFIEPKSVRKEIEKFKVENDSLHAYVLDYIERECHLLKAIPTATLKSDYELFCKVNDYEPENRSFGRKLTDMLTSSELTGDRVYNKKKYYFNKDLSEELGLSGFQVGNYTVDSIVMEVK